jgi:hypothetical protein
MIPVNATDSTGVLTYSPSCTRPINMAYDNTHSAIWVVCNAAPVSSRVHPVAEKDNNSLGIAASISRAPSSQRASPSELGVIEVSRPAGKGDLGRSQASPALSAA